MNTLNSYVNALCFSPNVLDSLVGSIPLQHQQCPPWSGRNALGGDDAEGSPSTPCVSHAQFKSFRVFRFVPNSHREMIWMRFAYEVAGCWLQENALYYYFHYLRIIILALCYF